MGFCHIPNLQRLDLCFPADAEISSLETAKQLTSLRIRSEHASSATSVRDTVCLEFNQEWHQMHMLKEVELACIFKADERLLGLARPRGLSVKLTYAQAADKRTAALLKEVQQRMDSDQCCQWQ